ncbi:MAG: hypothetical protein ACP5VR_07480 [Acidimicrobiales bacterium]
MLVVQGIWWELVGPGTAACPVGAALDPDRETARQFVTGANAVSRK